MHEMARLMVRFSLAGLLLVLYGCGRSAERDPCTTASTGAIVARCTARQIAAKCEDDPVGKCPEIVKACEAEIDEVCGG
jgi:hypothetical protein